MSSQLNHVDSISAILLTQPVHDHISLPLPGATGVSSIPLPTQPVHGHILLPLPGANRVSSIPLSQIVHDRESSPPSLVQKIMLLVSLAVDWCGMSFGCCTMLYSPCHRNVLSLKAARADQSEGQTKLHPRHTAPLKGEEQWLNYCVEY
jgi:hypothetical protein